MVDIDYWLLMNGWSIITHIDSCLVLWWSSSHMVSLMVCSHGITWHGYQPLMIHHGLCGFNMFELCVLFQACHRHNGTFTFRRQLFVGSETTSCIDNTITEHYRTISSQLLQLNRNQVAHVTCHLGHTLVPLSMALPGNQLAKAITLVVLSCSCWKGDGGRAHQAYQAEVGCASARENHEVPIISVSPMLRGSLIIFVRLDVVSGLCGMIVSFLGKPWVLVGWAVYERTNLPTSLKSNGYVFTENK